ncbi:MAG: bifunctional hydroxymethylpyrimidine kinase/phosphomethylpyrimidine kinase, partial [Nitrosopumilus sp.]
MGIPRVLTIAGSDSGGGAGIQADLKTFASLDVHGLSAVTSITAQNTMDVSKILDLPIGIIKAQITAVAEDIGFDAIKIGMLYKKSIVESIGSLISKFKVPIVVDPVMLSKSGSSLLDTDAVDAMVTSMLPRATVLTPNIHEAEVISNIKIRSIKNVKEAAKVISKLGPEAVVIKGGHLQNNGIAIDTLFWRNRFNFFEAKRIDTKDTHGTGCTFSSAIAANLAKRRDVFDAVKDAKEFVSNAIIHAYRVGGGHGPVNPS